MKSPTKNTLLIERIEKILKEKNMSRYRLARRSKLPQSSITNLLNTKHTPTIQNLEKVCNALDMTLAQFFSTDNTRPDLTEEQARILDKWNKLKDIEKSIVEAYMLDILNKK